MAFLSEEVSLASLSEGGGSPIKNAFKQFLAKPFKSCKAVCYRKHGLTEGVSPATATFYPEYNYSCCLLYIGQTACVKEIFS